MYLFENSSLDEFVKIFDNDVYKLFFELAKGGKAFLENATIFKDISLNLISTKEKRKDFDKFISIFPESLQKKIFAYIKSIYGVTDLISDIYDSNNPFAPKIKLTTDRIKELKKYNNFEINSPKFRKKKNESYSDFFNRIDEEGIIEKIPEPDIKEIPMTQEEKEKQSVEYSKYYNNKHGNTAIEFLESYEVNFPGMSISPDFPQNKLVPAFSGTGLVATNFILRFGFTVIPTSDSSIVGRALDIVDMYFVKPKSSGEQINVHNPEYNDYIDNGYFPVSSTIGARHYGRNIETINKD
jgi:hypothetical protein